MSVDRPPKQNGTEKTADFARRRDDWVARCKKADKERRKEDNDKKGIPTL